MTAGPYPTKQIVKRLEERLFAAAHVTRLTLEGNALSTDVYDISVSHSHPGVVCGIGFNTPATASAVLAALTTLALVDQATTTAVVQAGPADVTRHENWLLFPLPATPPTGPQEINLFLSGPVGLGEYETGVLPSGYSVYASTNQGGSAAQHNMDVRLLHLPLPSDLLPVADVSTDNLIGLEVVDDGVNAATLRYRNSAGVETTWAGTLVAAPPAGGTD